MRFDNWNTISVTELTRQYTNVYYWGPDAENPDNRWYFTESPALLIQECTSYDRISDHGPSLCFVKCPRETRIVYAGVDPDTYRVCAAEDILGLSDFYVGTFAGGKPDSDVLDGLAANFERLNAQVMTEREAAHGD
jgi:hypothetical protein